MAYRQRISLRIQRPFARPGSLHWLASCTLALLIVVGLAGCAGGAVADERGWSAPVVDEGLVYVTSRKGVVLAIKADDVDERGKELKDKDFVKKLDQRNKKHGTWSFPRDDDELKGLRASYSRVLVTDDVVYAVLHRIEGKKKRSLLVAVDKGSGDEEWSVETEGSVFGDPILHEDVIYAADDKGFVYAVDLDKGRRGKRNWKVSDGRFWSTPTFDGGYIYIGGMDKKLYKLNAASGEQEWAFEAGGAIASKPLVVGDVVYFGDFDRKFHAVQAETGERLWVHEGDGWFWNDPSTRPDGSTIYVGSLEGTFYALDAREGEPLWEFSLDAPIRGKSIVTENYVYVVAKNGSIVRITLVDEDGNEGGDDDWDKTVGAKVLASATLDKGELYIHDDKQRLHKYSPPAE